MSKTQEQLNTIKTSKELIEHLWEEHKKRNSNAWIGHFHMWLRELDNKLLKMNDRSVAMSTRRQIRDHLLSKTKMDNLEEIWFAIGELQEHSDL